MKKKTKVLTEEFLVEQLQLMRLDIATQMQVQKDFFIEYLHEQLRAQSVFLEARVEASRQDFRDHIGSVQKQLYSHKDGLDKKIDRLEKRMDGFYSELKTTQFAIRTVKEDTTKIEQQLTTVTQDHEERITRLEAVV